MQASKPDDEFERTGQAILAATEQMMAGDAASWKALLSPGDDVILMGAFGGYIGDRSEVDARFDQTASSYGGGGQLDVERIATWVGEDLACTVEMERHHGIRLAGHPPATTVYRVTHLFRREADGWRVVLRHADPLVEFRGPESVLPPEE